MKKLTILLALILLISCSSGDDDCDYAVTGTSKTCNNNDCDYGVNYRSINDENDNIWLSTNEATFEYYDELVRNNNDFTIVVCWEGEK
jgi:hypothetical protein